jgi:hypothetical protein
LCLNCSVPFALSFVLVDVALCYKSNQILAVVKFICKKVFGVSNQIAMGSRQ